MKQFKDFLLEETQSSPTWAEGFFGKSYSLDGALPEEIKNSKIIEKGYKQIAAVQAWRLSAGREGSLTPRRLSSTVHFQDSVVISGEVLFTGYDSDRFALQEVKVRFRFKLKFNKNGECTGIENKALSGSVNGYRAYDLEGSSLGQIKAAAAKAAKRYI
jgi:hypothetical protein